MLLLKGAQTLVITLAMSAGRLMKGEWPGCCGTSSAVAQTLSASVQSA